MKSNIAILRTIDDLVNEYKDLDYQMKVLTNRMSTIKSQLIDNYLKDVDTLYDKNNLVLVTYKTYETSQFKSTEFKTDHPDIYELYTEKRMQKRFVIK